MRAHCLDVFVEGMQAEMVKRCLDHAAAVTIEERLDGAIVLLAREHDQVIVVHVAVVVGENVVLLFHDNTPFLFLTPERPCAFAPYIANAVPKNEIAVFSSKTANVVFINTDLNVFMYI